MAWNDLWCGCKLLCMRWSDEILPPSNCHRTPPSLPAHKRSCVVKRLCPCVCCFTKSHLLRSQTVVIELRTCFVTGLFIHAATDVSIILPALLCLIIWRSILSRKTMEEQGLGDIPMRMVDELEVGIKGGYRGPGGRG